MTTLAHWLDRQADFLADKPALCFEGAALGYGDFAERVRRVARLLKHELGVGRGDRVAFLGYNSPDFLTLLFAAARLGAMFIPLNWRQAPPEHSYILADAGASVLVCEPEFQAAAESIRAAHPDCTFVAQGFSGAGWLAFEELLDTARGDDRNPHVDYSQPLLVVYTSGTTGHPKGAVLTQNALFWNAVNSTHMHDLTSQDRVLTVLPLFHVGGLNIQTLPALHAGATVLLQRRFEPTATLHAIAHERPSLVVLVPATLRALIDHPQWLATDLSSLRVVTTGSSIVPIPLMQAFHARGVPVIQVYGCTETAPIAIYQRREDAERTLGSTGKPALHCEIRIVDNEGQDVSAGEAGEILVRGPTVMYEYWGDEPATRRALREGWFYTGDIGHYDAEGYYYIDDRKKDLIISGGENIYPAELELVLHECPDIVEAAVVGRADERWGEVAVAVVVKRAGSALDEDGIKALFEGRLARYKHPRAVVFVERLPRNVMGKVLKFLLRT